MKQLRIIVIFLISAFILTAPGVRCDAASKKQKTRTIEKVRSEQQKTRKTIRDTGRKIDENSQRTRQQLRELGQIRLQTAELQTEIDRQQQVVDSLSHTMALISDSTETLKNHIDGLRQVLIKAMRSTQGTRSSTDQISFVFSAPTFREAWRRYRYIGEFARWQKVKTVELRREVSRLDSVHMRLNAMAAIRKERQEELTATRSQLTDKEREATELVNKLQSHTSELQRVLRENEQKARELDRELDRLIAAEQARLEKQRREQQAREEKARKDKEAKQQANAGSGKVKTTPSTPPKTEQPSAPKPPTVTRIAENERHLTGTFTANRGRLLFPVSGSYRIARGFGTQHHPEMRNVTTVNNGVDIATAAGASARAIFNGVVASIMQYPGCNTIVIVRHGEYYAVYSNLATVNVKVGDEVKAGDSIGKIYTDAEVDPTQAVLHFELRHGSEKLNPLQWVK